MAAMIRNITSAPQCVIPTIRCRLLTCPQQLRERSAFAKIRVNVCVHFHMSHDPRLTINWHLHQAPRCMISKWVAVSLSVRANTNWLAHFLLQLFLYVSVSDYMQLFNIDMITLISMTQITLVHILLFI